MGLSENEDILNSNGFSSCSLLILLKGLFIGIPYFDIVYIGIAIYCFFIGIAYMFVPSNPCCDVLSYWYRWRRTVLPPRHVQAGATGAGNPEINIR